MMNIYYEKNNVIVRSSVKADAEYLKTRLNKNDEQEVWDSHNHFPDEALSISFAQSFLCLTIQKYDEPIAMFGIVPEDIYSDKASIWLLSSDKLKSIGKRFAKNSPIFIKIFLSFYPYLENYVSVKNKDSIKWLKMCGARFDPPARYGIEQQMFQRFFFEREK